jgi:hypothetical protein
MARKAGSADLPLHGGQVPRWLADRMTRLGTVMSEAIVHHYGRDELLRRLAHPFWFQCFGAVMGMDWHSSGITTSVIGALKRGLAPLEKELGIHVCGGRGKYSRQTPHELVSIGERVGFDGSALATASRLVAKVDSAAVQDGFDLYLHDRQRPYEQAMRAIERRRFPPTEEERDRTRFKLASGGRFSVAARVSGCASRSAAASLPWIAGHSRISAAAPWKRLSCPLPTWD